MKILKLWARNARGISFAEVEVDPFGLSIVSAANEVGKSTLSEIPELLRNFPHTSLAQRIKDMIPIGDSGSPVELGMTFQMGDAVFEFEKCFIKRKSATLRQIEPKKSIFRDDEAEREFEKLLAGLDPILMKMVNLPQGSGISTTGKAIPLSESETFQKVLDQISSASTETTADESLFSLITDEYLQFWTNTGQVARGAGTSGKQIIELREKRDSLKTDSDILRGKLLDAETAARNTASLKGNQVNLETLKQIQGLQKELESLSSNRNKLLEAQRNLNALPGTNLPHEKWNQDLHEILKSTLKSHFVVQSASEIKVTAITDTKVSERGQQTPLTKGSSISFPQVPGLTLTIGEIAKVELLPTHDDSGLDVLTESKEHERVLNELGIDSYSTSEKIRDFLAQKNLLDSLEISLGTLNEIESKISQINAIKDRDPDSWQVAIDREPIQDSEIGQGGVEAGRAMGRLESLIESDTVEKLGTFEALIEEVDQELSKLDLKSKAVKLLFETTNSIRSQNQGKYAALIQTEFQKIVVAVFGADIEIRLNKDFTIEARDDKTGSLSYSQLSTGAKELIQVLLRLTVAQMVDSEEPVPLILDDEFAFTDKQRIAKVADYLKKLNGQQILLFTHQPEKFEALAAKRIDLKMNSLG